MYCVVWSRYFGYGLATMLSA
eukprot:COSAG05_NODE_20930_length_275_cov_60.136364_1_plen_20_part_10